ncbi:Fc.00g108550.m01.CDS01 [Cosmosporella sp. VM-42]
MTKRIFPINDWAPAQEAMLEEPAESSTMGATTFNHNAGIAGVTNGPRMRSFSSSLPWRRPKSFMLGHDFHHLSRQFNDIAIDDTEEDSNEPTHSFGHGHQHDSANHEHHHHHHLHLHTPGSVKGIIRRASQSLKGIVHRRPSVAAEDTINEQEQDPQGARPTTAHAAWNKLRQATSFRHHSQSIYGLDLGHDSRHFHHRRTYSSHLPIPGCGDEPPVIPSNSGAAAKASAALQNEYFARQSFQNKFLNTTSEDNDRESGIGIAAAIPSISTENLAELDMPLEKVPTISKVDFISKLPFELAIHILANLDCTALANASEVCGEWKAVIENQHIWRESCLRETTATYATSNPVAPGAGLGLPKVSPDNDWKEIYRVKQELSYRWKAGKASPVYLNGHLDSIYCLQFDEHKIVTGSRDKTIRVWDMHTLECRQVIGPPEVINDPEVLLDEEGNAKHFAAGSDSKRTAISMPTLTSFPEHHKASILCLQYDDKILVTGSSDATCIVYNARAGYRPIRRLHHHTAAVLDLAFDDKHIVTCSKDISICVWDRETGALLRQLRGHTGPVNAVQMRANTIVSCSGDFKVKLWNIDTGKNIREFVGHTKGLACSQFSDDGRYIASAGNDKVIRIWDANTGECIREMDAHENLVRSLHIDSVSGRLISGSYDTDIKVWDMKTGHQLLDFPKWHASWVLSAKSDYRRIVSTGQDAKILIMDFGADVAGIEMIESGRPDEDDGGFI